MIRAVFCALTLAFTVHAWAEDQLITKVEIKEVHGDVILTPIAKDPCEEKSSTSPVDGSVSWDEIVNIGQQVWQIIEKNRPVVHTEIPVAHALPRGLRCWTDLERWQPPRVKTYEVSYKNGFGMEVVKFRFRLQFTYGGTRAGLGHYIVNATVLPAELNVLWGYTFNARLDVGQTVNLGTSRNPLAGMEMNLNWSVSTVVKESQNSVHFFLNGNGDINIANAEVF